MWVSSCQLFKFVYTKSSKELNKLLSNLDSDELVEMHHMRNSEISQGHFIIRHKREHIRYDYCFNLAKKFMVLSGRSEARVAAAKYFIQRIYDDTKLKAPIIRLTREHALSIAKSLIKYDKHNKIIKPRFDFGAGYEHADGTTYIKFEYTLGDDRCVIREHTHFQNFYNNCVAFDFKASIDEYPGIADEPVDGIKLSVKGKFSFTIWRDVEIRDWYRFADALIVRSF